MEDVLLRITKRDGTKLFFCEDIENMVNASVEKSKQKNSKGNNFVFKFTYLLPQCKCEIDLCTDENGGFWIKEKLLILFCEWYLKEAACAEHLPPVNAILKMCKHEEKIKRKQSKKYRWYVAYRQSYQCNICKTLLEPDAFDIDHVKELRDGGKDNFSFDENCDNLQALCVLCHAKKTRRRTKELSTAIEGSSHKRARKSKYFRSSAAYCR